MREDLKNFEITTTDVNNCVGKDVYDFSLSSEKYDEVREQEYKQRLQAELEGNGIAFWLETYVKLGFWGNKPLYLDITSAESVDEYLTTLVEQAMENENKQNERKCDPASWFLAAFGAFFFAILFVAVLFGDINNKGLGPVVRVIFAASLLLFFTVVCTGIGLECKKENDAKKAEHKEKNEKVEKAKANVENEVNAYMIEYEEEYNRENAPTSMLAALLEEIAKYNHITEELVYNINVIDQLEDVGETVSIRDRDKVLGAFRTMRDDLVRALKVERILRENPRFKPELFSVNFAPLQDLKLSQQVANCEQLVNDALQIGVRVQETMRSFAKSMLKEPQPETFDEFRRL